MKYGLRVFKEDTITDDNFHKKKCSQLFTQMSGCSILLNCNLWFKIEEIKIEKGLL
jgi:hypothetical protein